MREKKKEYRDFYDPRKNKISFHNILENFFYRGRDIQKLTPFFLTKTII